MTVKLLIDTDIWLNLAKDYRMAPVLTAIEDLINAKAIKLMMHQVVLDEFARNRDRVVEDSKRNLSSYFKACARGGGAIRRRREEGRDVRPARRDRPQDRDDERGFETDP